MSKIQSLVPCFTTTDTLQEYLSLHFDDGSTVGFVPTMGALHDGHLSLVEAAQEDHDVVVVSIFVNPTQFGPNEDYERYPRDLDSDLQALAGRTNVLVYAPDASEIYGGESEIQFSLPRLSQQLCGTFRPGHFEGVLQVVAKLLNLVCPDALYLGQKDYQQTLVIRRMIEELFFPVELSVIETVREADGLALSSRNRYLTEEERKLAPLLYQCLSDVKKGQSKHTDPSYWQAHAAETLGKHAAFRLEYFEFRIADRSLPVGQLNTGDDVVVLVAAWLGNTRLIDNILL